ncbi:hypothetical protein [Streptomyces sp. NPDC054787]
MPVPAPAPYGEDGVEFTVLYDSQSPDLACPFHGTRWARAEEHGG